MIVVKLIHNNQKEKHYSSIQANTNGKTVRDWLNGKSFKEQQEYGLQIWEQFMKAAGYAIN